MLGPVLQYADLQELCRPGERPHRATVERWAKRMGLRYRDDDAGGIWTTTAALNAALGLTSAANDNAPYEF